MTITSSKFRPVAVRAVRLVASSLALATLAAATGASAAEPAEFETIRAATDKYQDVNTALADGYIRDPEDHCITAAMEGLPAEWGGMGIHYLRPDLLQISAVEPRVDGNSTYTDYQQPAILLYEPQSDGSLVLIGVENLVFQAAWKAAGHTAPPEFAGRTFDPMADDPATEADEAHRFAPHFDQHLWVFRDNPGGPMLPFNPNVSCEHHTPVHASSG